MIIGYRVTSYGFLAAFTGFHPLIIAQQGESDAWPYDSKLLFIKKKMASYAFKKADLIHAWSEHMTNSMIALGAPKEKCFILSRGINTKIFVHNNINEKENKILTIISTRSLEVEYQHLLSLKVMLELKKNNIPFIYKIFGSGSLKNDLSLFINNNGLSDSIFLYGKTENDKLVNELNLADIYLSLPVTEGLSASLMEAMVCGCFPIVTDLPGNRELIRSQSRGFLIKNFSPIEIANKIIHYWNNKNNYFDDITNNIELINNDYSINKNIHEFVERYNSIIDNNY